MRSAAVIAAIDAAGSVSALAEKLGISRPAVSQWEDIPMNRVADVERVTGIPRAQLRPDLAAMFGGAPDIRDASAA